MGFYVCGVGNERPLRILLLFDKLSSYKQVLFQSEKDAQAAEKVSEQETDSCGPNGG